MTNKSIHTLLFACLAILLATGLPAAGVATAASVPESNPVPAQAVVVPLGGNTWMTGAGKTGGTVNKNGISGWTSQEVAFTTYVRFAQKGKVKVWLHLKTPDGASRIRITALGRSKTLKVQGGEFKDQYAGEWQVPDSGYVAFHITGVSKSGETFADIASLSLSGEGVASGAGFVKNNDGNFFYWGKRGPSRRARM
jgi:hypothetical protein